MGIIFNIRNLLNKFNKQRFPAFSLLEIAISLAIIGVLTLAVIKGQALLTQARLDKTATQIEAIKMSAETFRSTFGQLPGDFNNTGNVLDNVTAGNSNGIIDANEVSHFWDHLEKAGLLTKQQKTPAIGGVFSIAHTPDASLPGHWILLSGPNGSGLLTSKDAMALKTKIDGDSDNTTGSVRIRKSGVLNSAAITSTKNKELVVFFELS